MEVEESSEEDDFRLVVGKRRRRSTSDDGLFVGNDGKQENLLNNNIFSSLGENNNNGDAAGNGSVPPVPAAKKERKQSPLFVRNTSFWRLKHIMSSCRTKPSYKITSSGIRLSVRTAVGFNSVRTQLMENNVEFYTHEKPSEWPYRVVVRGLPSMKPEKVKRLIKEYHNLDALEVHAIKRKEELPATEEVPYIVVFSKGCTNLKKLNEIKKFRGVFIRWEAYRNKRPNVTQCKNCLHLGHGTRNCHLKGRCNNCGGSHKTDACQVQEAEAKRCANCSGAHEATDRSCPKRAEFIRARQLAAKPKPPAKKAEKRPPVPALTLEEFPPLPGAVPDEQNPQPGGTNGGTGHGGTRKKNPQAGGGQDSAGSRADATTKADEEEELYSAEELWKLFLEFSAMLRKCRTRSDQERVVAAMAYRLNAK